jgi:hypothetical protein
MGANRDLLIKIINWQGKQNISKKKVCFFFHCPVRGVIGYF